MSQEENGPVASAGTPPAAEESTAVTAPNEPPADQPSPDQPSADGSEAGEIAGEDTAAEQTIAVSARSSARRGVALGLIVAGIGCVVAAAWILRADLADPAPGHGVGQALCVLLLIVTIGLGLLRFGFVRTAVEARAPHGTGLGAGAVGGSSRERWVLIGTSVLLALIALGLAAVGAAGLYRQFDEGFPGQQTFLFAVGGAAVAIGSVLGLGGPVRTGWRPRLASVAAAVLAMGLVAAITVPLALTADGWPVQQRTASAMKPAPVPSSVSGIGWRTHIDGGVNSVVSAGAGVVLGTTDDAVALDGRTGAVRWTYRRVGATGDQVDTSPDGATVFLQMSSAHLHREPLIVLDAETGRVRFTLSSSGEGAVDIQSADVSLIGITTPDQFTDNPGLQARSLRTGDPLWTFHAPPGCRTANGYRNSQAVAAGVLVALVCGPRGTAQTLYEELLDGRTGKPDWRYTAHLPRLDPQDFAMVSSTWSPDGRYFGFTASPQSDFRKRLAGAVLDSATGAVQPTSNTTFRAGGVSADGTGIISTHSGALRSVHTGQVVVPAGPATDCAASPNTGVLLSAGVVCGQLGTPKGDPRLDVAAVRTGPRTGGSLHTIVVGLGGPFQTGIERSDNPLKVVPAPGGGGASQHRTAARRRRSGCRRIALMTRQSVRLRHRAGGSDHLSPIPGTCEEPKVPYRASRPLYSSSMTGRVGAKGQVVIPKSLRDRANLHPGDEVDFELKDGQIVLTASHLPAALGGRFAGSGMASRLLEERGREPR